MIPSTQEHGSRFTGRTMQGRNEKLTTGQRGRSTGKGSGNAMTTPPHLTDFRTLSTSSPL